MNSDLPDNASEQPVLRPDYESAPLARSDARKLDSPLTRRDAALLAIRLVALYEGLLGLGTVLGFIARYWGSFSELRGIDLQDLLPAAIYWSCFLGFWFGAWKLSAWICRLKPDVLKAAPDVGEVQRTDLFAIGIALMGVWMLAFWAIPSLTQDMFSIVFAMRERGAESITHRDITIIMLQFVRIGVGLFLIVRSRRLAARWSKLAAAPSEQ